MGLVKPALKIGFKRGRPLAMGVLAAGRNADRPEPLAVVDLGDAGDAALLSGALGIPVREPVPDGVAVGIMPPDSDDDAALQRLGEYRRLGGDVLIVVHGDAVARRRALRRMARTPHLGVACAYTVGALDERGLADIRTAVVRRLGIAAVPTARASAQLTRETEHGLVEGASRRAAVIAALSGNRAVMPVLTAVQVRMAAEVSAIGGSAGKPQAATFAGVAFASPVWRQIARKVTSAAPGMAPVARAGLAYGVTRGVGMLAAKTRPKITTSSEENS